MSHMTDSSSSLRQRWQRFLTRALYQWRGWDVFGFIVAFSIMAAAISAFWYSLQGWNALPHEQAADFTLRDFAIVMASYGILFCVLNIASTVVYMLFMGWIAKWMGAFGHIPALSYSRACKLVLITGILPLMIILAFGQVLELSFSFGALLMVVHAAWLRNTDLPAAPPEATEYNPFENL